MCKAQIHLQNKEVNFITSTDFSRYFTLEMYIFVKSLKLLRICKTNGANSGSIPQLLDKKTPKHLEQ